MRSNSFDATTPDWLRNEDEWAAIGQLIGDFKDVDLIWSEAEALGVRVYEVEGRLNFKPRSRTIPGRYIVIHPADIQKLPLDDEHQLPVLWYRMVRIHKDLLPPPRRVIRRSSLAQPG